VTVSSYVQRGYSGKSLLVHAINRGGTETACGLSTVSGHWTVELRGLVLNCSRCSRIVDMGNKE
jgi:hypothetical protein